MGDAADTGARPVRTRPPPTNRTALGIAAMACATAAVIGHWHVNAGPLVPPDTAIDDQGIPVPTGPSLENVLDELSGTSFLRPTSSEFFTSPGLLGTVQVAPAGQYRVDRVIVSAGRVALRDGAGDLIGYFSAIVNTSNENLLAPNEFSPNVAVTGPITAQSATSNVAQFSVYFSPGAVPTSNSHGNGTP